MVAAASGIATYDDLVQRCQDWLFGRTDLAAQVPTFIQLFEAKANRELFCRQMENRVVTTIDLTTAEPEFLDLPTDFQSMRRVRLIQTANNKPRLRFAPGAQMDDLRVKNTSPGIPVWFSLFGSEMELCPTPNAAYKIEMIYRVYIPALGAATQTNWLLSPIGRDAYLYGTLMEAAPYLHDDERIPVWASGVQKAFDGINELSQQALYNAGPLVMRRSGAGYS